MRYMLLIYGDESRMASMTQEEMAATVPMWTEYQSRFGDVIRTGAPLQPTATATTVRVRDGQTLHTDGPFAETREQLGGYYLLESPSIERALEAAEACPGAVYGSVELRPIMELPGLPG